MSKFGRKLTKKHKKQEQRGLQPKLRAMREQMLAESAAMAYQAVLNTLAEFVQAGGRDAECFAMGAWAYASLGDFARASDWVQTTLEFEPQNASARVLLAWICVAEDREMDACDVIAFLVEHHYAFSEEDAARLEALLDACRKEEITRLATEHPACASFAGRGRDVTESLTKERLRMLLLLGALQYRVSLGAAYPEVLHALSAAFETLGEAAKSLEETDQTIYAEVMKPARHTLETLPQEASAAENQEAAETVGKILSYMIHTIQAARQRKLIVFLPYKASMWDSLESIWKAAREDAAHTETLVIPIPYCDRLPDGKAGAWHIEAGQFPEDVPVVDYRTVDLAALHPDAIFIHNPYDDINRVTSVDERYYSSKLVQMTDCLVYVPYYVSETVTSLCEVPGALYADYVITQDEANQRQFERNYLGGTPPPGKFLPLGSPKFDKARQARKENFPLPEEWRAKIRGRKILLFCTSIGAALQHPDKICPKMRAIFEKYREDPSWAFWWRPHPLLKATLQSMLPAHYEEYCQIEAAYRAEGWGIFDDTSNLERAMAYGDVYYGDHSSIVPIFKTTGKPVVFQDFDAIEEAEPFDIPVWTLDFAKEGEHLWFIEGNLNLLMRYTLATGRLVCMGALPDDRLMQEYAYYGIACAKGKVFILPQQGNHIYVYHVQEQTFTILSYPLEGGYLGKFRQAFVFGKWVYCIPSEDYPYLLRIDSETEAIEIAADLPRIYQAEGLPEKTRIGLTARYSEDRLLLACAFASKAILFHMGTLNYEILDVGRAVPDFEMGRPAVTEHRVFFTRIGKENGILILDKQTGEKVKEISTNCNAICSMDPHHVLIYGASGRWKVLDEAGEVVQEESLPPRPDGALQFFYQSMMAQGDAHGSYAFNMHLSLFYTFDADGRLVSRQRISLKDAENLPPLEAWHRDQEIYEFPGWDIERLWANHPSFEETGGDMEPVGKTIYQEIYRRLGKRREERQEAARKEGTV